MKGTEYIAGELKRLGLQPAGDNGTYYQDVPFAVQTIDSSSTIQVGETTFKAGRGFPRQRAARNAVDPRTLEVIFGGQAIDTTNVLTPERCRAKCWCSVPLPLSPVRRPGVHGVRRVQAATRRSGGRGRDDRARSGRRSSRGPVLRNAFTPSPFVQLVPDQPPTTPVTLQLTSPRPTALLGAPDASAGEGSRRQERASERQVRGDAPAPGATSSRSCPAAIRSSRASTSRSARTTITSASRDAPVDHDSMPRVQHVVRPQGADDPPRARDAPSELARIRAMLDSLRARARAAPRLDQQRRRRRRLGHGGACSRSRKRSPTRRRSRSARCSSSGTPARRRDCWGSRWFTDHPTVPRDSIVAQLNMDMIGRGARATSLASKDGGSPRRDRATCSSSARAGSRRSSATSSSR